MKEVTRQLILLFGILVMLTAILVTLNISTGETDTQEQPDAVPVEDIENISDSEELNETLDEINETSQEDQETEATGLAKLIEDSRQGWEMIREDVISGLVATFY